MGIYTFKVGDLVEHVSNKRLAIVMSDATKLYASSVCKVQWIDSNTSNVMDVKMLKNITKINNER